MKRAAFRKVHFGPVACELARSPEGHLRMICPHPLGAYPARLTERLAHWAEVAPRRTCFAQRDKDGDDGGGWRRIDYASAYAQVRRIGQALLDRGLSAERPVVILSENDIEHALLALAAMHVGVLYAPVSPAYSLVSTDFAKLRTILGLMQPGLVFAADGARYSRALAACLPEQAELVLTQGEPGLRVGRHATPFAALVATPATDAVERAHARTGPDTVAKILFTSGSTGYPKGVINTQRMLCANQQQILQTFAFLGDAPPVLVEWSPWHHTAAGNHQFGITLYNGGSFYIDEGRPVPGLIEKTVANLREISPTFYFNVPKGYEELIPYFRREPALRERFFGGLSMLLYAGAAMSQHVWDELDRLAVETCGERVLIVTGLGSTETAPFALCGNWDAGRTGVIGVPAPGVEAKLVPSGDKLEIRVRGPNVTPGYWKDEALTRAAFDAEGYYCFGDAALFVDPDDPAKGLVFDGRITEDFKLATATWVNVGTLRTRLILAGAPQVHDAVIAGHDRDEITALIFPNLAACRALAPGLDPGAPPAEVCAHPAVRARFQALLNELYREATGSSNRIERAVVLEVPPSIDLGEATDKGSINQHAVLRHRAAIVESLYDVAVPREVIVAGRA